MGSCQAPRSVSPHRPPSGRPGGRRTFPTLHPASRRACKGSSHQSPGLSSAWMSDCLSREWPRACTQVLERALRGLEAQRCLRHPLFEVICTYSGVWVPSVNVYFYSSSFAVFFFLSFVSGLFL